jgi:hypothetical protein
LIFSMSKGWIISYSKYFERRSTWQIGVELVLDSHASQFRTKKFAKSQATLPSLRLFPHRKFGQSISLFGNQLNPCRGILCIPFSAVSFLSPLKNSRYSKIPIAKRSWVIDKAKALSIWDQGWKIWFIEYSSSLFSSVKQWYWPGRQLVFRVNMEYYNMTSIY